MPAARKMIADQSVDPATSPAPDAADAITKGDVLAAAGEAPAPAPAPATRRLRPRRGRRPPSSCPPRSARGPSSACRCRGCAPRVAERLVQSQSTAAILTTFNEVNMQPVIDLRNRYKDRFEKEHGVKLGFMGFFVKAAVHALKKYPLVNASIDGNDIVYHGYYDIGIAVGSPRGLVVPILRDADQMSIADIEKQIADFGKRAQDGKLTVEELTGGTYTISNGGVFGSMLSTPIINPPQSAILGVHATKDRAVVENGQIVVRPMNYLAQSVRSPDHRRARGGAVAGRHQGSARGSGAAAARPVNSLTPALSRKREGDGPECPHRPSQAGEGADLNALTPALSRKQEREMNRPPRHAR